MSDVQRPRAPVPSNWLLLTPEEAAEVLRVGRTTIYALMKVGDLHGIHIGRSCRLSRAELERYVRHMEALSRSHHRRECSGGRPWTSATRSSWILHRRTPRESTSSPPMSEQSRTLGIRVRAVRSS